MNQLSALTPQETMTDVTNDLCVRRPVNVYPHVFKCAEGDYPPSLHAREYQCGRVYPIGARKVVPPHDHEHYEVSLVVHGTALHRTPMYESTIQRRDVLVVAPGQTHALEDIDGLHIIDCVYLTEWLIHDAEELWAEPGLLPLFLATSAVSGPQNPRVQQHRLGEGEFGLCLLELRGIANELERGTPSLAYLRRCLSKLMIIIGRSFAEAEGLAEGDALRREVRLALERIEALTTSAARFSVSELAYETGLSTSYFTRLFRDATGLSPMAYFQRRRIQHACWLLLHTEHSVTEIAYSLGYLDPPHFGRLFKSLRGTSPRAYRKRYRDAHE